MSVSSNLKLVRSNWNKSTSSLDVKAKAVRDEMSMALTQLAKQEIKGSRPYTKGPQGGRIYQKATTGQPPMNRTGDLRRSITAKYYRVGFGTYGAIVGPTIIYGRAVELGGKYGPPNWRNGEHFPYMRPAYEKFRVSVAPALYAKYFGKGVSE